MSTINRRLKILQTCFAVPGRQKKHGALCTREESNLRSPLRSSTECFNGYRVGVIAMIHEGFLALFLARTCLNLIHNPSLHVNYDLEYLRRFEDVGSFNQTVNQVDGPVLKATTHCGKKKTLTHIQCPREDSNLHLSPYYMHFSRRTEDCIGWER